MPTTFVLYSYICVQDAMTLMRLKIQTRKLIKTSTVYLYIKRANYSYAGLNCFIVLICMIGFTAIEQIQN